MASPTRTRRNAPRLRTWTHAFAGPHDRHIADLKRKTAELRQQLDRMDRALVVALFLSTGTWVAVTIALVLR